MGERSLAQSEPTIAMIAVLEVCGVARRFGVSVGTVYKHGAGLRSLFLTQIDFSRF
jgi:hypothetical protein